MMKKTMNSVYDNPIANSQFRPSSRSPQGPGIKDRRKGDRRHKKSQGFTQISIVGWICRRETVRRKEDSGTLQ
jgi:hypothetical protein